MPLKPPKRPDTYGPRHRLTLLTTLLQKSYTRDNNLKQDGKAKEKSELGKK